MKIPDDIARYSAALKAVFRPVFRSGIDDEARAMTLLAEDMRKSAEEITGAGRAIASMTEGKGE